MDDMQLMFQTSVERIMNAYAFSMRKQAVQALLDAVPSGEADA